MSLKIIIPILIVASVFVSGCSQEFDVSFLARQIPQVQAFLEEHPDAEISVVMWTSQYLKDNLDKVPEECLLAIDLDKSYFKVEFIEYDEKIVSFIEVQSREPVCVVRMRTSIIVDEDLIESANE